ncbi:hypothetical protein ACINK0_07860 [Deinococcus sp. VB343]|uniref:hypothetical protein n=1 Tax=Deinococcus sp. VB343 TaxID=3385567 RepID=UPI0039C9C58E
MAQPKGGRSGLPALADWGMFIFMVLASLLGGSGQPAPDAELSALRAKYVGKTVWVYGGGDFVCSGKAAGAGIQGMFDQPVKILDIERLKGTFPVKPVKGSGVLPAQPVKNPLRVRVRLSDQFRVTSWRGYVKPKSSDCREVTETYVNQADLEKNFSLTPPNANIRQIFAEYLKNGPLSAPNSLGLTHEQLLWWRGIPDEPRGDLNTLMKAQQWLWLGPPGRGDNVFYFQNDRVVKVNVPSMGP